MARNTNTEYEVMDSAITNEYHSEYDSDEYYSFSEEELEYTPDPDWNQVKGFVEQRFPAKSLIRALRRHREEELRERLVEIERIEKDEEEKKQKEIEKQKKIEEAKKIVYLKDDSDSEDDEEVIKKPVVEKLDFSFPSISESLTMKVVKQNTDVTDGWIEVKQETRKIPVNFEKKEFKPATSEKTKLCDSVTKNTTCRHGNFCRFAHSLEQLSVKNCDYGKTCNFVVSKNGVWKNNNNYSNRKCLHIHPEEEMEAFYYRTGLKKRPVEVSPVATPVKKEKKVTVPQVKKQKPVKFVKENLEAYKIREKNRISIRIKEVQVSKKRTEDTIGRIKAIKDINEFYKKELLKHQTSLKNFKVELETLEKELTVVNELKSVPILEVKQQEVFVKPEVKIEKKVQPKTVMEVTLYIAPRPKQPKPAPVITEVSKPKEEGWIEVKTRNVKPIVVTPVVKTETPKSVVSVTRDVGFDILKDKTKIDTALRRTKMCTFGKNCRRGSACRFAHSKKELTVSNCVFGYSCKFVKSTSSGIVNTNNTKICLHKHPDEHINNFYFRTGIDKVCQKY
jgi:hypothetical protein